MYNKLTGSRIGPLLVTCGLAVASSQCFAGVPAIATNDPFAACTVIPSQNLDAMRGASGNFTLISSNQEFKSTVRDIQFKAGTISTGTVTVGDKAFSGFSGIGVNVLNSGNANSITTGVNLTVNLH